MYDFDTDASNAYLKVRKKLEKVVADARDVKAKIPKTARWWGLEYTLKELVGDLEKLDKRVQTIWSQNVEPWLDADKIDEEEKQDLWRERCRVQEAIREVKREAIERGRTWPERIKEGMDQATEVLKSLVGLAGAYAGAKKALKP